MCTNRALVDSLECYMDDLVDCFEDFVKKSLVLISVGVGTVVVMLVYMLKVLTDRTGTPDTEAADRRNQPLQRCQSNTSIHNTPERNLKQPKIINSDFMLQYCEPKHSLVCKSANTLPMPVVPSFDEQVLRDMGFINCNQNCKLKKRTVRNSSTSRTSLSNLPLNKQYLSPPRNCLKVLKRASCCSMCGDDDDK